MFLQVPLGYAIVGAIAGLIARPAMFGKRDATRGCWFSVIIGSLSAGVVGMAARKVLAETHEETVRSVMAAFIGALVVLWVLMKLLELNGRELS